MRTPLADAATHPTALSHDTETIFPNILKIIGVDVALNESAVDVWACRNGAINKYGCDVYAGSAKEVPMSCGEFMLAYPRLATKTCIQPFFGANTLDEVHEAA
jgi:hypothetical protein